MDKKYVMRLENSFSNKVHYEHYTGFADSFFSNVYDRAAAIVMDILLETERYYRDNIDHDDKCNPSPYQRENDYARDYRIINNNFETKNNTINFIGSRGIGKSSAMLSFAGFLVMLNENRVNKPVGLPHCDDLREYHLHHTLSFFRLDVIDPSLMEKHETVFEAVIAKLFAYFEYLSQRITHNTGDPVYDVEHRQLADAFAEVYKAIAFSKRNAAKGRYEEVNHLMALSNLSHSVNIRRKFIKLIRLFLAYATHNRGEPHHRFVVIPIDDIDMGFDAVYDSTEEILKYLMVPNVIVLTSFQLNQYINLITNRFMQYKLSDKAVTGKDSGEQWQEKEAARDYLDKIYPISQRLLIPKLYGDLPPHCTEVYIDIVDEYQPVRADIGADRGADINQPMKIDRYLLREVFLKTRFRLPYTRQLHVFTPQNIRTLQNLLKRLSKLPSFCGYPCKKNPNMLCKADCPSVKPDMVYHEHLFDNINWFVEYVIGHWAANNLSPQDVDFIMSLSQSDDKNLCICTYILEKLQILKKENRYVAEEYDNFTIFKMNNRLYNAGDVLYLLALYKETGGYSRKLAFVLSTAYSYYLKKIEISALHHIHVRARETGKQEDNNWPEELNRELEELTKGEMFGLASKWLLPCIIARYKDSNAIGQAIIAHIEGIRRFSIPLGAMQSFDVTKQPYVKKTDLTKDALSKLDQMDENDPFYMFVREYRLLEILTMFCKFDKNARFVDKNSGDVAAPKDDKLYYFLNKTNFNVLNIMYAMLHAKKYCDHIRDAFIKWLRPDKAMKQKLRAFLDSISVFPIMESCSKQLGKGFLHLFNPFDVENMQAMIKHVSEQTQRFITHVFPAHEDGDSADKKTDTPVSTMFLSPGTRNAGPMETLIADALTHCFTLMKQYTHYQNEQIMGANYAETCQKIDASNPFFSLLLTYKQNIAWFIYQTTLHTNYNEKVTLLDKFYTTMIVQSDDDDYDTIENLSTAKHIPINKTGATHRSGARDEDKR